MEVKDNAEDRGVVVETFPADDLKLKTKPDAASDTAKPEPAAAADSSIAADVSATVDTWFREHIHGSPVGWSTEGYNHLVAALPVLKTMLIQSLAKIEE